MEIQNEIDHWEDVDADEIKPGWTLKKQDWAMWIRSGQERVESSWKYGIFGFDSKLGKPSVVERLMAMK
jgi:hypothetical protein